MNDLTILYAEDDETVRDNFAQILSRFFDNVILAADGEEAISQFEKYSPDVVLLDISMPKINGLDVAETMRQKSALVEIIMLTAYSDHAKLLKAVNLQLYAYLIKPVQKVEFDTVFNTLLGKLLSKNKISLVHDYSWDKQNQTLFHKTGEITITHNEKLLIELLIKHPARFYKPCDIAYQISVDVDESDLQCNNIVQLISRFKRKCRAISGGDGFFIANTYGAGYQLQQ